jgi:hypothetical protein
MQMLIRFWQQLSMRVCKGCLCYSLLWRCLQVHRDGDATFFRQTLRAPPNNNPTPPRKSGSWVISVEWFRRCSFYVHRVLQISSHKLWQAHICLRLWRELGGGGEHLVVYLFIVYYTTLWVITWDCMALKGRATDDYVSLVQVHHKIRIISVQNFFCFCIGKRGS